MDIEFTAIEFDSGGEAIQHVNAGGRGLAITTARRSFVVEQPEADRLAAAGVPFAYLFEGEMPDGSSRIVTVPIN